MLSLRRSVIRSAIRSSATRSLAVPAGKLQASKSLSTLSVKNVSKFPLLNAKRASYLSIQKMRYSSSDLPDYSLVAMPALSPTMEMGNIGTWKVKVGDKVEPGDVLVEIETDKAQMDFEYQDYGYIAKILKDSGSKDVPIEIPIAIIVDEEAKVSAFKDFVLSDTSAADNSPPAAPQTQGNEPVTPELKDQSLAAGSFSSQSGGNRIFASPLSKIIAQENSIDLSTVKGTGLSGSIVKSDILSKIQELKSSPVQSQAPESSVPAVKQAQTPAATQTPAQQAALGYHDIELTNMRKVIAKRLTESKTTVPHYSLNIEVNVDNLNKVRAALNETSQGKFKLTVNDFIVKAAALALKAVPAVNCSWQDTFIRQYHHADISIATSTPTGLITPIVKTCDAKGLESISNEIKSLAAKAKANKLTPEEYQGGSFSISNLGMYGISSFTAIINPPQSAILSVGTSQKKMIPDESNEKGFSVVTVNNFTLNADHRVVDGATGAEFLTSFKSYIENPLTMLL
ncbi:Dihydrolipoyllysine-residue acetyltransferase component of pyruvate dehydrogenase complex, mitochond [Smittium culicis]|uniref:Acetyltransferase component of pyruvate dehydrogenase complex n=1 Tax=Smittium culicis TaxID=133412 RepID=A0A1R1YAE2_9FUNG|nr:Dihydrolipoyllysine-residue acetyltransferase component of pyruvate dehydrogenase complex, mitochond [Smittium culicis]